MTALRRSMLALLTIVVLAAPRARADDHYAGLQLAPSAHVALVNHVFSGGVGAELSFSKALFVELSLSGQKPYVEPGGRRALEVSLGVYSRVGGGTHTFVYGAGASYTNRYDCPEACSLFAAIAGPEEQRMAIDLLSVDLALGYEARTASGFFFRALGKLQIPVYRSDLVTRDWDDGRDVSVGQNRNGRFFLTRTELQLTFGYAFMVRL